MRVVIDASVALKWVIRQPATEPNVDQALAILRGIRNRTIEAVAPAHFQAEVLAVVARTRPQRVPITFGILRSAQIEIVASETVLRRAADLTISLQHHLFDTLYHAVALETGATLVTSDQVYFGKAAGLGNIQLLSAFAV